jgi:hypothetical protein
MKDQFARDMVIRYRQIPGFTTLSPVIARGLRG